MGHVAAGRVSGVVGGFFGIGAGVLMVSFWSPDTEMFFLYPEHHDHG